MRPMTAAAPPAPPPRPGRVNTGVFTADRDLGRRSEAELIAQVLEGPEPAVQVLQCGEHLAQLPFWQRRALGVSGLVVEHGIPERQAVRLAALWELAERWFPDDRPTVNSPHDALLLVSALGEETVERVVVLMLDARYHLLRMETVALGGVNVSRLLPRDVLAPALRVGAAAIVVAHSHPSGDARPSSADRRMTAALREAAGVLGLPLLDHIVVARRSHYSFRRSERWHAGLGPGMDDVDGY
jgi:DNA repair protein RadC